MISTADFLAMMKGLSTPAAPGAQVKLGTIDAAYAGGNPKVTFDGESTLSGRGYAFLDTYLPIPGDRVALIQVGSTWLIVGSVDSSNQYPPIALVGRTYNTSSVVIGATSTETQTDSLTVNLVSGRLYEVTWTGNYTSTVADDTMLWRIREDSSSGTQICGGRTTWNSTSQHAAPFLRTHYLASATAAKTFVVTGQRSGSGSITRNGAASGPSVLQCVVIG